MSYLVLARKYRPQSFADLVGQGHVAQTLANAIARDRVAHAFLFTGVRGVGKTSSARILAKCLNCLGKDGKATGPTATPCHECAACVEISSGTDMDVQEIDGASYNGVDEVRRLQEGVAFRPARDRSKIYIVDEVHMLSNQAWNAFLKTLEEPPPHVKFIFATTEVQKVPVTILSRCQRYDFKLVSAREIGARLREVLTAESIDADDSAVATLAREAAGSMRDAMSLLDQVIAYGGDKLTSEDVARVLGVADREVLHRVSRAIVSGDAPGALAVVDEVAREGYDLAHFTRDLLSHMRDLVVAKVCPPEQARALVDLADRELDDVMALAADSQADDLARLFQGLSKAYDEIVKSGQVRASVELAVVRLAQRPPLLPLDDLLLRIGELERRLATGSPPPRGGPAPRGSSSGGGGGASRGASPASATSAPPSIDEPVTSSSRLTPVRSAQSTRPTAARTSGALALADEDSPFAMPAAVAALESSTEVSMPAPSPEPPPVSGAFATKPEPEPEPLPAPPDEALSAWRAILDEIRTDKPGVASLLELAAPLEVTKARVVIGLLPTSFEAARAEDERVTEVIAAASERVHGARAEVELDVSARASTVASVASIDAAKKRARVAEARRQVEAHPLVQKVISLFDAELREIRVPEED
ncbi:MAG: DNA polymerase III subunit gamma/tau [Myxococcales bacterium]|nr:DNA polymerase III subunit gamma/tau [Myxococcales bacterium]